MPTLLNLAFGALMLAASLRASTARALPTPTGEEPIAGYDWEHHLPTSAAADPARIQLVDPPPGMTGKVLKITNAAQEPLRVEILTINAPAVTRDFYALRGQVRYENVAGNGYLEMWNTFPGNRQYFSRTLGETPGDPMSKISGTSDWRPMTLPFNATGSGAHPAKLTVNVVLSGPGTVYLSALQLLQYDPAGVITEGSSRTGWNTQPGTSAGFGFFTRPGAFAALVLANLLAGATAVFSWMANRQRNRALVLAASWTLATLGVLVLAAGLFGWINGWPAPLWSMWLLGGLAVSGWFTIGALNFRRMYRSAEWRRMTALDA